MRTIPAVQIYAASLLPPWNELEPDDIVALLRSANVLTLSRGAEVQSDCGILLNGTLAVERYMLDGHRALATLFRPGDLIDLRRTERQRQGQLVVLSTCQFLMIDPKVFDTCLKNCVDIRRIFQT